MTPKTPTAKPARAAPEGRRARRKREVRSRIEWAAATLFLEQGYEATTVEQIAELADVAPATVFNHVSSKQRLLREMTTRVFGVVQGLIEEQRKRPVSTQVRLAAMADAAANLAGHARLLGRDILLELMRSTAPPGAAGPLLDRVHAAFAELIRDGQAQGDVRTDQDPLFLAEMVVGVFYGAITNWLSDPHYPLDERLRRTAAFIGGALSIERQEGSS